MNNIINFLKNPARCTWPERYVYIEETPLSDSEKQMVEEKKSEKDGHYDLRKIYKSHSFEEAEEKLFS